MWTLVGIVVVCFLFLGLSEVASDFFRLQKKLKGISPPKLLNLTNLNWEGPTMKDTALEDITDILAGISSHKDSVIRDKDLRRENLHEYASANVEEAISDENKTIIEGFMRVERSNIALLEGDCDIIQQHYDYFRDMLESKREAMSDQISQLINA